MPFSKKSFMFRENEKLYFQDIIDSICNIEKYIQGFSFDEFFEDRKTVDAVVRNLEIIGEASGHISKQTKQKYSKIPWTQIVGMRNKVIHEYSGVDLKILWQTLKEDIPDLKKKIEEITRRPST